MLVRGLQTTTDLDSGLSLDMTTLEEKKDFLDLLNINVKG